MDAYPHGYSHKLRKDIMMKRMLFFLLAFALSFNVLGCSAPSEEPIEAPINNELFTDEFFVDVVEIAAVGAGVVRGDQMQPVIQYFQSLTLAASDTHLIPQDDTLNGLGAISFRKSDGTEIIFNNNHAKMTCIEGLELCSYVLESGNLNLGMQDAFARAMEQKTE